MSYLIIVNLYGGNLITWCEKELLDVIKWGIMSAKRNTLALCEQRNKHNNKKDSVA